uniref:NADH dehydrogenase [ubiquinone] 1 alpha subcomplex assembly factor 3 n=1 Tax=Parastrongyloides trichosuri TaxID=131310 RepID=A0A0N5A1S7_PARTI
MLKRVISSSIKSKTLLRFYSTKEDTGVLTGHHMIPMGKSDVGFQTRVSFLSKDMHEANKQCVHTISRFGFRMIDGSFLYGPIAVFPKTVLSWRVLTPKDITPESLSLFFMLQPKIDILVVGCGDRKDIDSVRRRIAPAMKEHKIGLELMPTEDAIATFNFLNSEDRYVAAALYPPDDLIISDKEYGQALNLLQSFDELTENPFEVNFGKGLHRSRDIIEDLWSGKDMNWFYLAQAEIRQRLEESEKERTQLKDNNKKIDPMIEDKKDK